MDLIKTEAKESPGLCRCCFSEGCYKDLTAEYPWMSETEVYADMLNQCFNISLSQHPKGPDGATNLICEVCITRLRDASHFKKQVQDSERSFVNMMLLRRDLHNKEMTYRKSYPDLKNEDPVLKDLEEPEVANDEDVMLNEIDPLIKHELVKEEDPEDLQEVALEDFKLPDEDDGVSCSDSRQGLTHTQNIAETFNTGKDYLRTRNNTSKCTRSAGKSHHCKICRKSFSQLSDFQKHLISCKDLKFKKIACANCDKTFSQIDRLKEHMYIHSGVKAFSCNVCGIKFTFRRCLKRHDLHVHSEYRPFCCDICRKAFNKSSNLKRHLLTHRNLRAFGCEVCDKKFTRKYNLKKHMLSHSGVKSFSCKMCKKSFQLLYSLKRHLLTHTKLRLFLCDMCDKSFTRKDHLITHIYWHSHKNTISR